jgi:N-acetylglucosamine kinase-like BadF-type ATPase
MRYVLGIDAGGTKTRALLTDESERVLGSAEGGGANLKTNGELEVEKVLHEVVEGVEAQAGVHADAVALGIAGAERPRDQAILRGVLRRIGFRERVVITNDARIVFVAGSKLGVGLALVCGTGSIAWGRNAGGEVARAGGRGWHVGDEGSGFWIGERAIRAVLRAEDGRGPATALRSALLADFGASDIDGLIASVYDNDYPRHRVAVFAGRVESAAAAGDAVAAEILESAAAELVLAARTVVARLDLERAPYDVILAGGTFAALPRLRAKVGERLASAQARVASLDVEPAVGAVRLALEELGAREGPEKARLSPE